MVNGSQREKLRGCNASYRNTIPQFDLDIFSI
jgi:hypothetical protein